MASYRPICDTWILCRSKVKYYGAYPAGFLGRARQMLGIDINDSLLHICGGKVKDYPFYGLGPNDRTIDIDPKLEPDFIMDVRQMGAGKNDLYPLDLGQGNFKVQECSEAHENTQEKFFEYLAGRGQVDKWPAALIDRPYTEDDAKHYFDGDGAQYLPDLSDLLARALSVVKPGGRVGVLDYYIPRPPKKGVRFVACIGVIVGFGNLGRFYTVFENDPTMGKKKVAPEAPEGMDEDEESETERVFRQHAETPLGGFPDCKACNGSGKNSKGGPCGPCEKKRIEGELSASLNAVGPANIPVPPPPRPAPAAPPPSSAAEAALGGF